jgi:hypothetical protein
MGKNLAMFQEPMAGGDELWDVAGTVGSDILLIISYRTSRKKGLSDLHNLSGFPVDKTVVSDTVHREPGAGPDCPIGAPR